MSGHQWTFPPPQIEERGGRRVRLAVPPTPSEQIDLQEYRPPPERPTLQGIPLSLSPQVWKFVPLVFIISKSFKIGVCKMYT